jgi:hypothetical protein
MGLAQWVNAGSLVVEDNQRFPPERWVSRIGAPRSRGLSNYRCEARLHRYVRLIGLADECIQVL